MRTLIWLQAGPSTSTTAPVVVGEPAAAPAAVDEPTAGDGPFDEHADDADDGSTAGNAPTAGDDAAPQSPQVGGLFHTHTH